MPEGVVEYLTLRIPFRVVKGMPTVHVQSARWTPRQAEAAVKEAIAKAGPGGGFILSDNHGEIPWQVPEEVLLAISAAVHKWGRYPLDWIENKPSRTQHE